MPCSYSSPRSRCARASDWSADRRCQRWATARSCVTDEDIVEGMRFHAKSEAGPRGGTVVGVEGDQVTIDGNHPLAGMTLHFDVTIADVRDASEEEISHGHAHGPCGHDH